MVLTEPTKLRKCRASLLSLSERIFFVFHSFADLRTLYAASYDSDRIVLYNSTTGLSYTLPGKRNEHRGDGMNLTFLNSFMFVEHAGIADNEQYVLRVSMGLTVSRKTAKNLAVRRKNERILTVSRKKMLTVKKSNLHNLSHGCRCAS